MNTVQIGTPTIENVDTALESIGFVKITAESTATLSVYRWGNDTEAQIKFAYDSSHYFNYNFNDGGYTNITVLTTNGKICYELLRGGGIAFGLSNNSDTPIQCALVAPRTSADDWAFMSYNSDYKYIYDYSRRTILNLGTSNMYNNIGSSSNDVQIIKIYNGLRFMDNIYRTILEPSIASFGSVRATFGQQEFLLCKMAYGNDERHCWAFEL